MSTVITINTTNQEQDVDDDENLHHIAYWVWDKVAMCGHVFRKKHQPKGCDPWDPDDPYAPCGCGAAICARCIELCLLWDQLEEG